MKGLHNYFIPYAMENTVADKISATYAQRLMGRLDVMLSTIQQFIFLYSDWLYFLWHGIKKLNVFFFHTI